MLGHVAQSIGGALPGASGIGGALRSLLYLPQGVSSNFRNLGDETFALIEVQAAGGSFRDSFSVQAPGGAASDGIIGLLPGDNLSVLLSEQPNTVSYVRRGSTNLIQALSPNQTVGGTPANPPSGKYPGKSSGLGGGRLSGRVGTVRNTNNNLVVDSAGPGAGSNITTGLQSGYSFSGGVPVACITTFASYDAALAFANSLYNGAWVP